MSRLKLICAAFKSAAGKLSIAAKVTVTRAPLNFAQEILGLSMAIRSFSEPCSEAGPTRSQCRLGKWRTGAVSIYRI